MVPNKFRVDIKYIVYDPVGKIAKKAVCMIVFLTTWQVFEGRINKHSSDCFFLPILPTGGTLVRSKTSNKKKMFKIQL